MPGGSPTLRKHALELAALQLTSTAEHGPQVQLAIDCLKAGTFRTCWTW